MLNDDDVPGAEFQHVWHVVRSDLVQQMLYRVQGGESAEMVYMEFYVNADKREDYRDE